MKVFVDLSSEVIIRLINQKVQDELAKHGHFRPGDAAPRIEFFLGSATPGAGDLRFLSLRIHAEATMS